MYSFFKNDPVLLNLGEDLNKTPAQSVKGE